MNLHVGDWRIDIVQPVGLPDADMRDLKGYDAWNSGSARFLGATGYWYMLLTYDSGDRLSTRHVSFVPFESGGVGSEQRAPIEFHLWHVDETACC
ncbi:MAG: hypothetical protein ACR2RV_28825 [Verrucomicrobiales bacterium]